MSILRNGPSRIDDLRFVLDLGLCARGPGGSLQIANPIYREVIPRVLSYATQLSIPEQLTLHPTWLDEKGQLDPKNY